jgi:carbon monoxide dehydrogenase subunit G
LNGDRDSCDSFLLWRETPVEQTGEYRIAAPREAVWRALNDPEILRGCIAGCLSMDQVGETSFEAKVKAKIGPVSATFDTRLEIEDPIEPESYRLCGNVKGGAAGFAKGEARVQLSEEDGATLLRYTVVGHVGGKLAQVGSRLIDAVTRKIADDFFSAFGEQVAPGSVRGVSARSTPGVTSGGRYESSGRWTIWVIMFAVLLLALLFAM